MAEISVDERKAWKEYRDFLVEDGSMNKEEAEKALRNLRKRIRHNLSIEDAHEITDGFDVKTDNIVFRCYLWMYTMRVYMETKVEGFDRSRFDQVIEDGKPNITIRKRDLPKHIHPEDHLKDINPYVQVMVYLGLILRESPDEIGYDFSMDELNENYEYLCIQAVTNIGRDEKMSAEYFEKLDQLMNHQNEQISTLNQQIQKEINTRHS